MTKEEAIEALKKHMKPGESVVVERKALKSLTDYELLRVYNDHLGARTEALRAVVEADRRREVERLRDKWGLHPINWRDVAEHLGVEVSNA